MVAGGSKRRRRITIAIGALLAIAGALGYIEFYLARPIGSGPAGAPVNIAAFDAPWTERQIKLVGIGDSVTAGLGASRSDLSYFRRLVKNPPDELPDMQGRSLSKVLPMLETLNIAVSGTTSLEHLRHIEAKLPEHAPEVFGLVVITTGGNDLIHSYGRSPPREGAMYGATFAQAQPWIANFALRLDQMLDLIAARFPGGCHIFLADIYDPTDGVGDAPSVFLPHWPDGLKIHAAYNEIIHRAAENRTNVTLVPLYETFLGHGSHCRQFWRSTYRANDPHYWYFDNIEDPNDRGYDAARRAFLNAIISARSLLPPLTEKGEEQQVPK